MGYLYGIEILVTVAFVLSSIICWVVVLKINARRDLDHQIPLLKSFLYALVWTPATVLATCAIFW
jgi:hypothetical protein